LEHTAVRQLAEPFLALTGSRARVSRLVQASVGIRGHPSLLFCWWCTRWLSQACTRWLSWRSGGGAARSCTVGLECFQGV